MRSKQPKAVVRAARRSAGAAVAYLVVALGAAAPAAAASLAEAEALCRTGKYAACATEARGAVREGRRDVGWRLLLVKALVTTGQRQAALAEIDALEREEAEMLRALVVAHDVRRRAGDGKRAAAALARGRALLRTPGLHLEAAEDLVAAGQLALAGGDEPKAVLAAYFEEAVKRDPDCRAAYLAAGTLALEKHDDALAADWFGRGSKRLPDDPDLRHGLARAHLHGDRKAMTAALDAALHVNPQHLPSLLLRAEHEIDGEAYAAARKTLDRVHAVDAGEPEAWAFRAVLAHLAADAKGEAAARARALASWPANPGVDALIGRKLSEKYRFAEGSAYQRRALALDSKYLPAKMQLAQDLLRLGQEREGWALAEEVHAADGYDVVAFNLVTLKESLAKYATVKDPQFVLRMAPKEAAIWGEDALSILRAAKGSLDAKYGWKAARPTTVEIFAKQSDFAVRTFGMPGGSGYLGVCFGSLITANSPAGNAGAVANWQAVLWHEYAHVVTLGLSRNKMPRWLSEGISVHEELARDPAWGQRMTPRYRDFILGGELVPIGRLSSAFLAPRDGERLMFAYYQSALAVEFLVERYGIEALKAVLRDLGDGIETNRAIEARMGPLSEIDPAFEAFARKRAQAVPAAAKLAPLLAEADRHLEAGAWQKAKGPLGKAIALHPDQAGAESAFLKLALAHRKLGEAKEEREVLEKLAARAGDAAPAFARLVEIGEETQDLALVAANAERLLATNPMAPTAVRGLARGLEARAAADPKAAERAVSAYRKLLLLEPADAADVGFRLARLLKDKDPRAARRHLLDALSEAPRFREGHRLLLELERRR